MTDSHDGFRWHDTLLPYWDAEYNNTRNNERAVELSIVHAWREASPIRVLGGLEVGNVLAHYGAEWRRRVVDRYEVADGVENIDVAEITGAYPWIVAVSTVEHVGVDDGSDQPDLAVAAVHHLRSLLAPGGRMLVTVPFGYNLELDDAIAAGEFGVIRQATMHRHGDGDDVPTWTQAEDPVAPRPYDRVVRSARAVWIGEW